MAPQLWQEVKEILGEAFQREPGKARDTYVSEACGHNPALRQEVTTYLSVSGEKLEACANNLRDTLLHNMSSNRIGQRLGAYRIVREIGRGGMGSVFLAARADGEFEKEVAIKLLKRGTDTDEIVRRFRSERQILAKLEHPGIARLVDAGSTEEGLPYFVMEFVHGLPITDFVREQHLSVADRLELFLKVCAAVEYSHRDRIVHRDLKPTNILVTPEGEPKILDFGIAKLLQTEGEPLDATVATQKRFTPTCVSPEQARGEQVTTASDIYALGALLYEILTDRTPHQFSSDRPSPNELMRVVCEEEAKPPSEVVADPAVRNELKGNLNNIVRCALAKDPVRRYPTVRDFSEDIRRHLNAQPIRARSHTTAYRVRRLFVRNGRMRPAATAALLIAGLFASAALALLLGPRLRSWTGGTEESNQVNIPAADPKSIAVLPFESFGNQPDQAYFADGVQDNVLTDLAKVSDLKVISRSGVERYRGQKMNAHDIGRALHVAHVLEGSVQKSGDRLRVNVRLVETRTEAQTWSEHYEGTMQDLLGMPSELAQSIVTQLRATLSPAEKAAIERRPTEDIEAYDLFLRARALMSNAEFDSKVCYQVLDLLDKAIARDPNFALAYSFAAEMNVLLYRYKEHTGERLAMAKQAAAMALQLAPELGESHLAQATYYYHGLRDYYGAERELAISAPTLGGKTDFLLLKQLTERRFGHWKDALRDGEKAISLSPRDPVLAGVLIETYSGLRMYPKAEMLANDIIAQLPASDTGRMWAFKCDIALAAGTLDKARGIILASPGQPTWRNSKLATVAYYERNYPEAARLMESIRDEEKDAAAFLLEAQIQRRLGNSEKSRAILDHTMQFLEKQINERPDDPDLQSYLAVAHAALGEKEEAFNAIQRAVALAPAGQNAIDHANSMSMLGEVHALNGETDAALAELAKVVQLPYGPTYGDLRYNPEWDTLRSLPRFQEVLTQAARPLDYN